MFYNEFYSDRKRAIECEIQRNIQLSELVYSDSKVCQRKGKQALKALQRLRAQLDSIIAAESLECEMWESMQSE